MSEEPPVAADPPELSRPFHLAELAEDPERKIEIETTAAERKSLAERYSLLSLDALTAQLTVRRDEFGEIVVTGHLQAETGQECVVTLEPMAGTVAAPFEQRYTLQAVTLADDLEFGPEVIEPPEPVIGEVIDLGELVAQHLSLAINPYPRALNADTRPDPQYRPEPQRDGPFGVLSKLRDQGRN